VKILFFAVLVLFLTGCQAPLATELTIMPDEHIDITEFVTKQGGTETPFDNAYWNHKEVGIYVDVNTNEPLFSSEDKFSSGTGWPSFTAAIPGSSIEIKEDTSHGMKREEVRTDESHLGHVFDDGPNGQPRYCINSASLRFIPFSDLDKEGLTEYKSLFNVETAVFGGGCFWGVEHLFSQQEGVLDVVSGYMGGDKDVASYRKVSTGKTGHAEVVQVLFDPDVVSYQELVELFWRMHDPTQVNRQGPDVGPQYRSVIFYYGEEQRQTAEASKDAFDAKGIFDQPAATEIVPATEFHAAEEYHQDYVENNPNYVCHELRDE
jgi:peptide methionine sulfoxide reductase msrA/msrB